MITGRNSIPRGVIDEGNLQRKKKEKEVNCHRRQPEQGKREGREEPQFR